MSKLQSLSTVYGTCRRLIDNFNTEIVRNDEAIENLNILSFLQGLNGNEDLATLNDLFPYELVKRCVTNIKLANGVSITDSNGLIYQLNAAISDNGHDMSAIISDVNEDEVVHFSYNSVSKTLTYFKNEIRELTANDGTKRSYTELLHECASKVTLLEILTKASESAMTARSMIVDNADGAITAAQDFFNDVSASYDELDPPAKDTVMVLRSAISNGFEATMNCISQILINNKTGVVTSNTQNDSCILFDNGVYHTTSLWTNIVDSVIGAATTIITAIVAFFNPIFSVITSVLGGIVKFIWSGLTKKFDSDTYGYYSINKDIDDFPYVLLQKTITNRTTIATIKGTFPELEKCGKIAVKLFGFTLYLTLLSGQTESVYSYIRLNSNINPDLNLKTWVSTILSTFGMNFTYSSVSNSYNISASQCISNPSMLTYINGWLNNGDEKADLSGCTQASSESDESLRRRLMAAACLTIAQLDLNPGESLSISSSYDINLVTDPLLALNHALATTMRSGAQEVLGVWDYWTNVATIAQDCSNYSDADYATKVLIKCAQYAALFKSLSLDYGYDVISIRGSEVSGISIPRYDRYEAILAMSIATYAALAVTAITIGTTLRIKRTINSHKAIRSAQVERDWNDFIADPTEENFLKYDSAVAKTNALSSVFGGTKYARTGFWNTDNNSIVAQTAGSSVVINKLRSINKTLTGRE